MNLQSGDVHLRKFRADDADRITELARIHTGVYEYNPASQRVLEKCGYVKEGVFRKSIFKMGKLWDEVRYAKVAE